MKRLIVVLTACLCLAAAPSTASASTAGTLNRARHKIAQEIGQGTVVGSCRILQHKRVRCAYSTPASNVGIETGDPNAVFSGGITVTV